MTSELKEKIYNEADATFEEYADGHLECDVLDYLYDLLTVLPDSFFEQFDISYDTKTIEWAEEDLDEYDPEPITYEDPKVIFTPKKGSNYPPHRKFHISCRGYEFTHGDGEWCNVAEDNTDAAQRFYDKYYKMYDYITPPISTIPPE